MNLQLLGITLILFVIIGIGVIYIYVKKQKDSTYQSPKTRLEEGKFKS